MNEEERRVIVDQEMVKALKFLTDAEELARLEMWNVVANRAYYALYHAVMAMMVNDGFLPKTHSGLITEFGREYVITGKIDPKYSKVLSQMRPIRENCDTSLRKGKISRRMWTKCSSKGKANWTESSTTCTPPCLRTARII